MLEQQKPKDLSDSEWTQVLATKMDAMAKVVNQAMTGTPDAVAVEEAKRINPEMSTRLANLQNMFRPGYDVFRPQNLERAKNMLYDLYNLNISRSNAAYNSLAKSSNPEYAASRLPQIFKPVVREGVLPAIERISRKSKQSTYSPEASNQNTQAQKLNSPIGKPNRVVIGGR
jgi:hypothetical protein